MVRRRVTVLDCRRCATAGMSGPRPRRLLPACHRIPATSSCAAVAAAGAALPQRAAQPAACSAAALAAAITAPAFMLRYARLHLNTVIGTKSAPEPVTALKGFAVTCWGLRLGTFHTSAAFA